MSGETLLSLLAPALAIVLVAGVLFGGRLAARRRRLLEMVMALGLTPLFAWAVGGAGVDAVIARDWPALALNLALLAVVVWAMVRLVRRRRGSPA